MRLLFMALIAALSAGSSVVAAGRTIGLVAPPLGAGDRVSEITIRLNGAQVTVVRGVPTDWIVSVDNDVAAGENRPPDSARIDGHAVHGVAFLYARELARMVVETSADCAVHPDGEATIANPQRADRKAPLSFRSLRIPSHR